MSLQGSEKRHFQISTCLGRGGFGEVYRATMLSAGGVRTEVAIKVLQQDIDPFSQAAQRLRDEARLLGILNHPNILKVTDLVTLEGRVALVTEYIEGADLDQCILDEQDPIPLRPLLESISRVSDALHAAHTTVGMDGHALQLVHRDIKPSNIRLSRHGGIKLLDFGIAKARDDKREAKTQTNALIGSFLYMAPERFDSDIATMASDIYSLGVTLFEGLARRKLFEHLSVRQQYMLAFDRNEHDPWLERQLESLSRVPPDVVDLLRKMIAYEADERPGPQELSAMCDEIGEGLKGPTLRTWCKRHSWPSPEALSGPLDGKTITETLVKASSTVFETPLEPPSKTAEKPRSWMPFILAALILASVGTTVLALGAIVVTVPATMSTNQQSPGEPAANTNQPQDTASVPRPPSTSDAGASLATPAAAPEAPQAAKAPGDAPLVAPPEGPKLLEVEEPDLLVVEEPDAEVDSPATEPSTPGQQGTADDQPWQTAAAPEPRPAPRSRPEPMAMATFEVTGAPAELRNLQDTAPPGPVRPGSWELWADFGLGMQRVSLVELGPGQNLAMRCSILRKSCWEDAP